MYALGMNSNYLIANLCNTGYNYLLIFITNNSLVYNILTIQEVKNGF